MNLNFEEFQNRFKQEIPQEQFNQDDFKAFYEIYQASGKPFTEWISPFKKFSIICMAASEATPAEIKNKKQKQTQTQS